MLFAGVYSVLIHCGHDVFGRLHGGILSTSIDHELHHAGRRGNFGLYFSAWDRVMGTWIPSPRAEENP